MSTTQSSEAQIAVALEQLKRLREDVSNVDTKLVNLDAKIDNNYVTKNDYKNTQLIVDDLQKKVEFSSLWIRDFRNTYKVIAFMAAMIGSLMSALVTFLSLRPEIFK